jgi:phage terminase Nu1 subunit (DNA packaging protein)
MPDNTSRADTVLDADQTLAAVAINVDLLPSAEKYQLPLEEAVKELKVLSIRQQTLIADKQKVTQDLRAAERRVKDLLIHLRAAVRSDIGPRSEKLVEFKVAPLRPRSRKAKPAEPVATKLAA